METNVFSFPNMGKHVLRSTGEEVEIIAYNQPNNGMRTEPKDLTSEFEEGDWVTYIDSEGKEHIREHLNYQLDFKLEANNMFTKLLDDGLKKDIPSTMNAMVYEMAKELLLKWNYGAEKAVGEALELVKRIEELEI